VHEEPVGEKDKTARIIIVGSELLNGIVKDDNLYPITHELSKLGFYIDKALFLHDNIDDIVDELHDAINSVDLIIVTGGLGPTEDDITRYAVAKAVDSQLIPSKKIIEDLKGKYTDEEFKRRIKMCLIPEKADVLENDLGVAPGFYLNVDKTYIFVIPGVPREARKMLDTKVIPILRRIYDIKEYEVEVIHVRFWNIREKDLEDIVMDILKRENLKIYFKIVMNNGFLTLTLFINKNLTHKGKKLISNIISKVKRLYPDVEYELIFDGAGGGFQP